VFYQVLEYLGTLPELHHPRRSQSPPVRTVLHPYTTRP